MTDKRPTLAELIAKAAEHNASDVAIVPGTRPHIRVAGELVPLLWDPAGTGDSAEPVPVTTTTDTHRMVEREMELGTRIGRLEGTKDLPDGTWARVRAFRECGSKAGSTHYSISARLMPTSRTTGADRTAPSSSASERAWSR